MRVYDQRAKLISNIAKFGLGSVTLCGLLVPVLSFSFLMLNSEASCTYLVLPATLWGIWSYVNVVIFAMMASGSFDSPDHTVDVSCRIKLGQWSALVHSVLLLILTITVVFLTPSRECRLLHKDLNFLLICCWAVITLVYFMVAFVYTHTWLQCPNLIPTFFWNVGSRPPADEQGRADEPDSEHKGRGIWFVLMSTTAVPVFAAAAVTAHVDVSAQTCSGLRVGILIWLTFVLASMLVMSAVPDTFDKQKFCFYLFGLLMSALGFTGIVMLWSTQNDHVMCASLVSSLRGLILLNLAFLLLSTLFIHFNAAKFDTTLVAVP
jgi:hypothetical protein